MLKGYLKKRTNLDSNKIAWERSWCHQENGSANIIGLGRKVYNYFLAEFLKKYINEQTELLEFGCGTATIGVAISKDIKSYTGFDIAENALAEAQNNFKKSGLVNYSFAIRDITQFNPEKQFDVVWSHGLIEHFESPYELIDAHLSACKTGGRVVISVPGFFSYHSIWYLLTRPKLLSRFWPWPDQIFISKKIFAEYMKLLKNNYTNYQVISLKPRILGLIILVIEK